ncbi:MAG: Lrp/AsnC family transcriptional regulator [Actinomycetota bacterium]
MPDIDATDARLLLALAQDARLSGVELAQRLGLSRNTVQARLARLESTGLLGSTDRRVDLRGLGYPLVAFISAKVDQHRLGQIEVALAGIAEVIEVHGIAGEDDIMIRVAARDTDDLYRVTGVVLDIPGVDRTELSLSMREMVSYRTTPLLTQRTTA